MKRTSMALAAAGLVLTLKSVTAAGAVEITLLCSNAVKPVVEEMRRAWSRRPESR